MISVPTQRFGTVQRPTDDLVTFANGIYGFELQLRWLLLGDQAHGALYWLQNIEQPDLSLAIVDPREFISDYALHVKRAQLSSIWSDAEPLLVFCVLTEYERQICLNLRNPILVNAKTRLGRQVVAANGPPLRYILSEQSLPLKESA